MISFIIKINWFSETSLKQKMNSMKKKGFDREKAKKDLENIILDKIKEHYIEEHRKAKAKNDLSKKSDADTLQIDELLKKMAEIKPNLGFPYFHFDFLLNFS